MIKARFTAVPVAHQFAGLLYWASLLLFLGAVWVLINPLDRRCGELWHVYLTLATFELYVWFVLALARWQVRHRLIPDAARSGVFATVLTGLLFCALNEVHANGVVAAYWLSLIAVLASGIRLIAAKRWLGLSLSPMMVGLVCLWLVVLAGAAPLVKLFAEHRSAQHAVAYLVCWGIAAVIVAHLPVVGWQARRGWSKAPGPLGFWYVPWWILGILGTLASVQLYAVMYGLFVGWVQWYYSPIFFAAGVVAICLAHARGRGHTAAWMAMGLAVLYTLAFGWLPVPEELPSWLTKGIWAYVVHPVYPNAVFLSVILLLAALIVHRRWLVGMAIAPSVTIGLVEASQTVQGWRHGKAVGMLLGAFGFLGAGAALQWWQEHRGANGGRRMAQTGQEEAGCGCPHEDTPSGATADGDTSGPGLSFEAPGT